MPVESERHMELIWMIDNTSATLFLRLSNGGQVEIGSVALKDRVDYDTIEEEKLALEHKFAKEMMVMLGLGWVEV